MNYLTAKSSILVSIALVIAIILCCFKEYKPAAAIVAIAIIWLIERNIRRKHEA